jgi:isopenicillin-N epimerase
MVIRMRDEANLITLPAGDSKVWMLDPNVIFLNHGSFGSCPRPVLEYQRELRDRMEQQPVLFLVRELEGLLDEARAAIAQFVGANANNVVLVSNATAGVNTVLRSLVFQPGDELLVTNYEYNACRNALVFAAERCGAKPVVAEVPFPCKSPGRIIEAILSRVTARTRIALLDHVTSQTALVLPIAELVRALAERGVDTLVDGAHAPGMVPLNLESLGAAYYTGNCHKWLCAPKTAAFLYVRSDRQKLIRPLVISHGANSVRTDRSRFLIEFAWMGTSDPTPALSVARAISFVGSLLPGGWPAIMARNRELALAARKIICEALKIEPPCPDEMIGSMASVPIPDAVTGDLSKDPFHADILQAGLMEKHGIEVPIIPWPAPPKRLLRISAQLYNSLPQYRLLAEAMTRDCFG